jgi:PEP-CTERM motif
MRALLTAILLTCLVGMSLTLHAGIIERDLESPGDGLLTYDTVNHREWLDLPETGQMRLADVLGQMEPGGRLEGFQFAMLGDVSELATSAGVGWTWTPGPYAEQLIDLLGITISATAGILGDSRWSNGLIAQSFLAEYPVFDDTNVYVHSNYDPLQPGTINHPLYVPTGGWLYADGPLLWPDEPILGFGDIGPFWLYRSAVPEPSALMLFGLAAICATSGRGFVR